MYSVWVIVEMYSYKSLSIKISASYFFLIICFAHVSSTAENKEATLKPPVIFGNLKIPWILILPVDCNLVRLRLTLMKKGGPEGLAYLSL